MGDLSKLNLDISYRSDTGNVVADFYIPCLSQSTQYRRAAGYFTSQGLTLAAKGIARLIKAGGSLQLVVSPYLTESDISAIEEGYQTREQVLQSALSRGVADTESELTRSRLSALAWLISVGSLDIKLAFRIDPKTNRPRQGIYHEKIGIFSDLAGNHVAFTGSQNETEGGLLQNFESIDVFCSWRDSEARVSRKVKAFEDLWDDATSGLAVIEFTEVSREILNRFKTPKPPVLDEEEISLPQFRSRTPGFLQVPRSLTLRPYQLEAITNWFRNNGTGLLEMATGTGKTVTALGIAARLAEKIALQALIVVCPYKHLVTQWDRECRRFGAEPLLAYENRANWYDGLSHRLSSFARDPSQFLCLITTNATFGSDAFQTRLKYFPEKTLLVADEVHNLGAAELQAMLPEHIRLRLGLSATPERWFDVDGSQRLKEYFGKILEPKLGIREAIQLGALVPYRYYPILVDLTDEEQAAYLDLSAKIARFFGSSTNPYENVVFSSLLLRRARLIGTARNKLAALRDFAATRQNCTHMLFYCGDGSVECEADHELRRQVDEVARILGSDYGIRVGVYVAETPSDTREAYRLALESGQSQGLVAIRCLDEGVDIPAVRTAVILASSSNPRQFVQRRGRVLRTHPGKSAAEMHDMIVVPPPNASVSNSERSLLRREFHRFAEFADTALNSGEARAKVLDLQKRFNLLDI